MGFSRQKKNYHPPTQKKAVTKCNLWKIFQLNVKIKKNQ